MVQVGLSKRATYGVTKWISYAPRGHCTCMANTCLPFSLDFQANLNQTMS